MRSSLAAIVALAGVLAVTNGYSAETDDTQRIINAYLQKSADDAAVAKRHDLIEDPASPVLGNPAGDVTIIEFFDYKCPYCKAAEPRLEQLLKDDGHVKLVLKDFPILTPESRVAARAALAARNQGQAKYEAYHLALIGFRGDLTNDKIFEIAKDVGLDVPRLRKDMDAPEISDHIISNMNLARSMKITGTPAFIVDAKVLSGAAPAITSKISFPDEVAAARARKAAK